MNALSRSFVVSFAVALLLPLSTLRAAEPLPALDAFIEAEMAREKVPGLAIAVVKDGKVIYQRGFGYRDTARQLPVTANTAFPIASVSKSFTVLTLGTLVEQGKLDWDRPVREYSPDFQLYDPNATALISARDMVSHRTGLPRHDAVWYGATVPRKQMWDTLRYLQPNAEPRERYQYNNLMFLAAGYLAGELAGEANWEALLQKRIFDPLAMRGSSVSIAALAASQEPSLGYVKDDEKVVLTDYANIDAIAPAGAINSTLADMTRYLQLHLGDGKVDGQQIVSASVLREMRMPQISDRAPPRDPEFTGMQYGMGLFLSSYRGHRHVYHGGNIDGFTSFISYLPEDGVGVVMLSNLGGSQLRDIIPYRIYDQLLGMEQIDWSGRLAERKARNKAAELDPDKAKTSAKLPTLQRSGTRPSHAIAEYVGEYEHPAYGVVSIAPAGRGLSVAFHGAQAPLEHFHYDVFKAGGGSLNNLDGERLQFDSSADGDIAGVSLLLESNVAAIRFTRRADPAMSAPAFLSTLTGQYSMGADTVEVRLREDGTLLLVNGGNATALVPISGTRFGLDKRERQSIEFQKAADGSVRGFVQYSSWGNRQATRAQGATP